MAISPGQYNFSLQRRADHSITLEFDDSTGTFTTADAEEFTDALAAGLLDDIYSLA